MIGYHLIDPIGHEVKILVDLTDEADDIDITVTEDDTLVKVFYLSENEWVLWHNDILDHFTSNPMTQIYPAEFNGR
tara:strand:+ start:6390 stop:6617 length:228 start_codon:yes stop_codon:yes gene_type:complete